MRQIAGVEKLVIESFAGESALTKPRLTGYP